MANLLLLATGAWVAGRQADREAMQGRRTKQSKTGRQAGRQGKAKADRQTCKAKAGRLTDRQRQTDRQGHADGQTGRAGKARQMAIDRYGKGRQTDWQGKARQGQAHCSRAREEVGASDTTYPKTRL